VRDDGEVANSVLRLHCRLCAIYKERGCPLA
jgi:hypothetical protein